MPSGPPAGSWMSLRCGWPETIPWATREVTLQGWLHYTGSSGLAMAKPKAAPWTQPCRIWPWEVRTSGRFESLLATTRVEFIIPKEQLRKSSAREGA